jgi:hypothetical protein
MLEGVSAKIPRQFLQRALRPTSESSIENDRKQWGQQTNTRGMAALANSAWVRIKRTQSTDQDRGLEAVLNVKARVRSVNPRQSSLAVKVLQSYHDIDRVSLPAIDPWAIWVQQK